MASWEDRPQSVVDDFMHSQAIKIFNSDLRKFLGIDFSVSKPQTKLLVCIFRVSGNVFESQIRKTRLGYWEEQVNKVYRGRELDQYAFQFTKSVFQLSQNF